MLSGAEVGRASRLLDAGTVCWSLNGLPGAGRRSAHRGDGN